MTNKVARKEAMRMRSDDPKSALLVPRVEPSPKKSIRKLAEDARPHQQTINRVGVVP